MHRLRAPLIWVALGLALGVPVLLAAQSPLLAWRQPVYIVAGFAGVLGLGLILLQPLLAGGNLPGLPLRRGRYVHRVIGSLLVASVVVHVAGLWLTSPPDVIDALLFRSPTPFSPFGVLAMWAIFGAALLAALRRRLRLPYRVWRNAHTTLAMVIVLGTVLHALLIEGTMEPLSKLALCALVVVATAVVIADLRGWFRGTRGR
ncbi:ferric reductase-like transmembrane domain-containing protein [Antarctobacter sp.]|uniref:ferric reductase-like transmembrane domain-containing protein n=1 Tax=Antarctobacter sp. TaxID=1872577 RepID=UPI002B269883|nr:ferric reductase-like transmembrane domain-containing protein [Antarctobacter sp.]